MKSALVCLFAAAGLALPLLPQSLSQSPSQSPLAFDVASVKPSPEGSPNGVRGGCHGIDSVYTPNQKAEAPSLGRCVITDARLSHLIDIAWEVRSMSLIKSGPDWIARGLERFDVVAKAADPAKTTEAQLLTMLQNLLVERFQLKFHQETENVPGFALVVAKTGAKLQESKSDDAAESFGDKLKPQKGQPITLKARRYSMATLVSLIGSLGEHGPGIDRTGLKGVYDFTLSWDEEAGPSLSTALREQLGLRMESEKVPESYFVVDSAHRPSAN